MKIITIFDSLKLNMDLETVEKLMNELNNNGETELFNEL